MSSAIGQFSYSPPSSPISSKGKEPEDSLLENLSLRKQYQIRKEKMQEVFAGAGWQPLTRKASDLPETVWDQVAIEPKGILEPAEAIAILSVPIALNSVRQVRGRGFKEVVSYGLPILATCAVASVGLALIGGGAYAYTTRYSSYKDFEEEILEQTRNMFHLLRDPLSSLADLSKRVDNIFQRRSESSLESLFDWRHPNEMYQFLIARGIVLDSQNNYEEAQQIYESALSSRTWIYWANDHSLRHILHYLYARSLRLSGRGDLALTQIEQIPANSLIHLLGSIERTALQSLEEAFDEEDLPFALRCDIDYKIMQEPVYYEHNGHAHHYERTQIENWLQRRPIEPTCGTPLHSDDLRPDPQAANAINFWRLTQLRRNP